MKILFVGSGNSPDGINPVLKNQIETFVNTECHIDYFPINGRGFRSYVDHIYSLKRHLKKNRYEIVHAHYALSAYVAAFAGASPLFVSLMGSDVYERLRSRSVIRIFKRLFFDQVIVKSNSMRSYLGVESAEVIPNGVDLSRFHPMEKSMARKELNWSISGNHILFGADPSRYEKNFQLVRDALQYLKSPEVTLHTLCNIPPEKIPYIINASNVVLISSLWEGSPNVIKEAMACNVPAISTRVGDIDWLFGDMEGYYLSGSSSEEYKSYIEEALRFSSRNGQTKGRERIINLGLSADVVASRLIELYRTRAAKTASNK